MIIRNSYSERPGFRRCKPGTLWPSLFDKMDFVRETPQCILVLESRQNPHKMLPGYSLVRESRQNPYKGLIISFRKSWLYEMRIIIIYYTM